jgi:hypothetical protein
MGQVKGHLSSKCEALSSKLQYCQKKFFYNNHKLLKNKIPKPNLKIWATNNLENNQNNHLNEQFQKKK